ncbi:glycosyltransferase [Fructobacillus sp. W13]|uniref:Glycosyltransferase n=1 Tax=Fructobacillus apis TaxID=2935017 RepID=A0ABT0ZQF1_9LACO|nr:glycosyltransferase [Fructobacillus apis]MCO0832193.1 glycosyltransferase [Fructobacillus apis]
MNIFLNSGLYDSNSGVEHAQFYRMKAFQGIGEPVKLVYSALLPKLHEHMALFDLKEEQVLNLYDWAMADDPDQYLRSGLTGTERADYKREVVKDFTQTNRTVTEQATGGYTIVRRKEKVYREDKKLYLVSDAQVELSRGDRRLSWSYDRLLDDKVMVAIHLENFCGQDYYFQNFYELLSFFMGALEKAFGPATYFLDRERDYDEYLVQKKQEGADNRLVSVIHAGHRVEQVGGRQVFNQFYQFVLDHADAYDKIVVATKRQAADLKEDLGERLGKTRAENLVAALPVGFVADQVDRPTDQLVYSRPRFETDPLHLVTASRLHQEKHIDQLIDVVAKLKDQEVAAKLTIFGRGPEKEALEGQVEKAGLQEEVVFAGVSDNLEDDFAEYDCYVSASYSEGFGLTYLEAMNAGLPVVTYANEYGAKELIDSGKNGLLVAFSKDEENREANVSGMVQALLEARAQLADLQEGAFKSVKAYGLSKVQKSWQKLLAEIKKGDNHANSVD